jgi:hypothetical protein
VNTAPLNTQTLSSMKLFALALLHLQAALDRFFGFSLPLGCGVAYTVTAANVLASAYAETDTGILGEASMTAGMPVYKNAADNNRLYRCDANASLAAAKCVGILLHGGGIGQPARFVVRDPQFTPGCTLTAGDIVIVGATNPGEINPVADLAAGWFPTVLGPAVSTSKMDLNISRGGVAK